ncbi:Lrguk, partial [Symbiodinium necroappetens]
MFGSWLRDNCIIAWGLFYTDPEGPGSDDAVACLTCIARFLLKYQSHKMEMVINGLKDVKGDEKTWMDRPHIRFIGETGLEDPKWYNHKQNDALGYFMWARTQLAWHKKLPFDGEHLKLMGQLFDYLRAIECWEDLDGGHWEEHSAVHASSVGPPLAAVKLFKKVAARDGFVPPCKSDTLDVLESNLQSALGKILPNEIIFPTDLARDSDSATVFLAYPLEVVDDASALQIMDRLKKVMGHIGMCRYRKDSYWCKDYKEKVGDDPTKHFTDEELKERDRLLKEGEEAQWCLFDPMVSAFYGRMYQKTKDAKYLTLQQLFLARSLAAITGDSCPYGPWHCAEAARLLLGPEGNALKAEQRHLRVAATSALLWPPVEPVWAYVVRGWRRLFAQRAGSGGGFELRTEMQHKLYKERRFFELASEGLTWSWTVLRAAFLFGFARPLPALWSTTPPEGPPVQIPPLSLRVVFGPWSQLNWAPSAWWRDLLDAAPGSRIHQPQAAAFVPFTGAELRQQLPRAAFHDIKVESMDSAESAGEALVLAAEVAVTQDLLQALRKELVAGHPVLATARSLATLAELWNLLSEGEKLHLRLAFVGANPFASQLRPAAVGAAPVPGRWARISGLTKRADLNGSEALIAEERDDGRWRVSTSSGDLAVRQENLEVFVEEPWPPTPSPGLSAAEWKAICNAPSLSTAADGGTNAFWLGMQPCGRSQKMCPHCGSRGKTLLEDMRDNSPSKNGVSFSSFTAPYSARDSYAGMSDQAMSSGSGLLTARSLATTAAGTSNPEFEVQIDRAPGSSLGLNLDALDGQSLIISAVKAGPIRAYNEAQEDEDLMLQRVLPAEASVTSVVAVSSVVALAGPGRSATPNIMDSSAMSIAVIIPAMNEEKALPATLRAVFSQEPPPSEVVVVDPGSVDRTQDVARSCGASVLTSPRGRSLQMNAGAKSTKVALAMKAAPKPKAKNKAKAKAKAKAEAEPQKEPLEVSESAIPLKESSGSVPAGSGAAAARAAREAQKESPPSPKPADAEPAEEATKDAEPKAEAMAPDPKPEAKEPEPVKIDLSSLPDPWAEVSDDLALTRIKEEDWEVIFVSSEASAPSHLAAKDSELDRVQLSDAQRTRLVAADVSENQLASAEALGGPLWLRYLNLSTNPFTSLEGLAELFPRLLVLDLSFVELSEVLGVWRALAELPRLRKLQAEGCGVASFEDLEKMSELRTLELNDNALEDLAELDTLAAKCPNLLELDLRENDVASEPGYAKKVKKLWPKLTWFDNQSLKKYVAAGAAAVYDAEAMREKDVAAVDGMFKNESCSCLEGNPCVDPATCKAPVLLFLHADTHLPPGALAQLQVALCDPDVQGGCFELRFDEEADNATLRLWSWFTRTGCCRTPRLVFGDRGIFVRRKAFEELTGYREWPLLEDVDFAMRLAKLNRRAFHFLPIAVTTSARRMLEMGPLKQQLLNTCIIIAWYLGASPARMRDWHGDSIVEVNGARGSSQALLERLKADTVLVLYIKRPVAFTISIARAYAPLGLQVEHAPNGTSLLVKTAGTQAV